VVRKQQSPTTKNPLKFLSSECHINLSPDILRKGLRNDPELRMIKDISMEYWRVECDPNDIESYFDELARLIDGKPAAFIFNLDDSGFQAWADKHVRHVIVPACYQSDEIPIPVDRAAQRNSLLAYIAADGTYLRPLLILPCKPLKVN
jgi:hypothetical protein